MFGVMLVLPIPCFFVLLRLAEKLRESWRPSWYLGILSPRQVLSNNVLVNHCDMLKLIWWDLIGFPRSVYPTPCLPLNFWVVLLFYLAINVTLWPCSSYVVILIIVLEKIIVLIGTWSLTWDIRATTRVEWDVLGWLISKASGGLPYPKGARAVEELCIGRFLGRSCCDDFSDEGFLYFPS
jgi:hypothetical protein